MILSLENSIISLWGLTKVYSENALDSYICTCFYADLELMNFKGFLKNLNLDLKIVESSLH